jgi:hypothetical protein
VDVLEAVPRHPQSRIKWMFCLGLALAKRDPLRGPLGGGLFLLRPRAKHKADYHPDRYADSAEIHRKHVIAPLFRILLLKRTELRPNGQAERMGTQRK